MTRIVGLERKVRELLENGSLTKSECSQALLDLLSPLIDTGVLSWLRRGAGQRLVISQREPFKQFIAQTFPHADTTADDPRVQGIASYRDSKSISAGTMEIVCVRAWSDDALRHAGEPTRAGTLTEAHGVFSFFLGPASDYTLHGSCALVENRAFFSGFEKLHLKVAVAIYGCGRVSDHVLDWLGQPEQSASSILHCPDYDPVGLNDYMRLKNRLGDRVSLFLPQDLEELFGRFSKRALLFPPQSQAMLLNLREVDDESVKKVVVLMDRYGGGLEQESLLISHSPAPSPSVPQ